MRLRNPVRASLTILSFAFVFLVIASDSVALIEDQAIIDIHINVIVINDGVTELSKDATFDGSEDPVGELAQEIWDRIESEALVGVNDIFASCGVGFALKHAKVARPELIHSLLWPEQTMTEAFSESENGFILDLGGSSQTLNEFAGMAIHQKDVPDQFELYRDEPHLTMFVTGADLMHGEFSSLAVGQVQGRYSIVKIQTLNQLDDDVHAQTIAHEWGHNLGLLHVDRDGFAETDDDENNLMFPYKNEAGNYHLLSQQCQRIRQSPLLVVGASNIQGEIRVPETFSTIQEAVAAAAPGATIIVNEGHYPDPIFIDKPITVIADEGKRVLISRDRDGLPSLLIDGVTDVRIAGLEISGDGINVLNSINVSIEGNVISNNIYHGIFIRNARDITALHNEIKDNGEKGIYISRGLGILISDNAISGNDGQFGAGIESFKSSNVRMENNVIFENMEGIVVMEGNENLQIVENRIFENQDYGLSLFFFLRPEGIITECRDNDILNNRVDIAENIPAECKASDK